MPEEPFTSGRLLLPQTPPEVPQAAGTGLTWGTSLAVALSVLLLLLVLRSFLNILPYLWDGLFRARGSSALEGSVRVSRDRNLVAAALLPPAFLLIFRYRLFDIGPFDALSPDGRLLAVSGVFLGYVLLRFLLYAWLRPRHRLAEYQAAYRSGFTFFILLMLLALATVGILYLAGAPDLTVKTFLLVEAGVAFVMNLLRRGHFLSSFCKPLTTFSNLCALELLPAASLVVPAVIL